MIGYLKNHRLQGRGHARNGRTVALLFLVGFLVICQGGASEEVDSIQSIENLELITQRMKRLSRQLRTMPEVPELDRKIMLPQLELNSIKDADQEKGENA